MVRSARDMGCWLLCGLSLLGAAAHGHPAGRVGTVSPAPVATTFDDTQGRFHVGLPAGWDFAPQPGDVGGMYFRRMSHGVPANAVVRIMAFTSPIELQTFAARIAAASDQEPGFHLLQSEPTMIGRYPGLKRRFMVSINGNTRFNKVVEQRILVVDHFKGYVLHVETLADAFAAFAGDFATLFASFAPGPQDTGPAEPDVTHVRRVHRRDLIGTWAGGGHSLTLSPGGAVIFDGQSGTYKVLGGTLILSVQGTERIYPLSLSDGVLQLSGGVLGAGQTFDRQGKAAPTR